VVVCSAVCDLSRQADPLGAAALLTKPVEFDRLAAAVRALDGTGKPGVLVVDDEPQIRRLLDLILTREGFTVWTASGGREAAELYRQYRDRIRAVLLDVHMPEMDGLRTLSALRKVNPQVRAVFVSGNTGDHDVETLLSMGASGVVHKPFDLKELTGAVGRLLSA
jgi:DNA-binding response OmpR family regulator